MIASGRVSFVFLFNTRERIFAGFELNPHRRTLQVQNPPEGFFQIAYIMVWYRCRLVTVDNNNRWVVFARVCVTQLDSTTIEHGRLVLSHGVLQYSRQKRSEEHTSELQSRGHLVCRLLLDNK